MAVEGKGFIDSLKIALISQLSWYVELGWLSYCRLYYWILA